ncbi:hypothetical protein GR239_36895 [Rhizobium leguminosarum]|nr:hypothetical protein [Rhizobium ruizarguesonis]
MLVSASAFLSGFAFRLGDRSEDLRTPDTRFQPAPDAGVILLDLIKLAENFRFQTSIEISVSDCLELFE